MQMSACEEMTMQLIQGMPRTMRAHHADWVAARLGDADPQVRAFALYLLGSMCTSNTSKGPSAQAAQKQVTAHTDAVASMLTDPSEEVRSQALLTLARLCKAEAGDVRDFPFYRPHTHLAGSVYVYPHSDAIVAMLGDADGGVRKAAALLVREGAFLVDEAGDWRDFECEDMDMILAMLRDDEDSVRCNAMSFLYHEIFGDEFHAVPHLVRDHLGYLAAMLGDASSLVRCFAVAVVTAAATLCWPPFKVDQRHIRSIATMRDEDEDDGVRAMALAAMIELEPGGVRALDVPGVVALFGDEHWLVREFARGVVYYLPNDSPRLVEFADTLAPELLDDVSFDDRLFVLNAVFLKLEPEVLSMYAEDVAAAFVLMLDSPFDIKLTRFVCDTVKMALKVLDPELLKHYAGVVQGFVAAHFKNLVNIFDEDSDFPKERAMFDLIKCPLVCDAVVGLLGDSLVRESALSVLRRIAPREADENYDDYGNARVARYVDVVAGLLGDGDADVRFEAVVTLRHFDRGRVGRKAGVIANTAQFDQCWDVRRIALRCLERLAQRHVIPFASAIASRVSDDHEAVRLQAVSTLGSLGLHGFGPYVGLVVTRLNDESSEVRHKSLKLLGEFVGDSYMVEAVEPYADAALEKLGDEDPKVCRRAVQVLGMAMTRRTAEARPSASAVERYCGKISSVLQHPHWKVRREALRSLRWGWGAAAPAPLGGQAEAVAARLLDSETEVVAGALRALGDLGNRNPRALAKHSAAVAGCMDQGLAEVRGLALKTLGLLDSEALEPHADAVCAKLRDMSVYVTLDQFPPLNGNVRCDALRALQSLAPEGLAKCSGAVAGVMTWDTCPAVRCLAAKTLRGLAAGALADHAGALVARLRDEVRSVRRQSLKTLGCVDALVLKDYVGALVARVGDEPSVRFHAVLTLRKLKPADLIPYRKRLSGTQLLPPVLLRLWRQLFWAQRLIFWWNARAWEPGKQAPAQLARQWAARL